MNASVPGFLSQPHRKSRDGATRGAAPQGRQAVARTDIVKGTGLGRNGSEARTEGAHRSGDE